MGIDWAKDIEIKIEKHKRQVLNHDYRQGYYYQKHNDCRLVCAGGTRYYLAEENGEIYDEGILIGKVRNKGTSIDEL